MAGRHINLLRRYELRLLRCSIAPPFHPLPSDDETSTSLSPLHSHITNLLTSIESGEYLQALSSDAAHLVFYSHELDTNVADEVITELLNRVEAFVYEESDRDARVVLVMCVAVAALLYFTQCNMTG